SFRSRRRRSIPIPQSAIHPRGLMPPELRALVIGMVLTDEQKQAVAAWIEEGAKPADVQGRLEKEFDIRITYMEVRFLIDDLKVMPKDPAPPPEPPKPAEAEAEAA